MPLRITSTVRVRTYVHAHSASKIRGMAPRKRDLTEAQNAVVREWMRRLVSPSVGGTGTMTQTELAEHLEIQQPQVAHILGEKHGTSWQVAYRLALLVHEDFARFMQLRPGPPPVETDALPPSKSGEREIALPDSARTSHASCAPREIQMRRGLALIAPPLLALACAGPRTPDDVLDDAIRAAERRPETATAPGPPMGASAGDEFNLGEPAAAFPPAVAGIRWGLSPSDAARTCLEAGGEPLDPGSTEDAQADQMLGRLRVSDTAATVMCTRPPLNVGLGEMMTIEFCGGTACSVMLVQPDATYAAWARVRRKLETKYGLPSFATAQIPDDTGHMQEQKRAPLASDVCKKSGIHKLTWLWRNDGAPATVRLVLACERGQADRVAVVYDDPDGVVLRVHEFDRVRENY